MRLESPATTAVDVCCAFSSNALALFWVCFQECFKASSLFLQLLKHCAKRLHAGRGRRRPTSC